VSVALLLACAVLWCGLPKPASSLLSSIFV
jgi:hypothetical protein